MSDVSCVSCGRPHEKREFSHRRRDVTALAKKEAKESPIWAHYARLLPVYDKADEGAHASH